ncbi:MAG: nucleotidyltransferase domain-containing protein [Syntrophaceae bacterium]|nr:nucleotidyltransferase domain-containing protein [Syntrophaceae bacterium]
MTVLLNTRLRKNLLRYSFTHPDENYYVRELAGLILEDAGNLSRELRKLEAEGLYTSFTRGRTRFYSLNKQYPLYQELREIISKTEGVEGSLRDLVASYKEIILALIYGSYAKNKEKKTSDIDLLVVGTFPQAAFTRQVRLLESKLNREINVASYTKQEFDDKRKRGGEFLNLVLTDKTILLKGSLNA